MAFASLTDINLTFNAAAPRIFPHCSHKLRKFNVSLALIGERAMIAPYFRTSRRRILASIRRKKTAGERTRWTIFGAEIGTLEKLVEILKDWISVQFLFVMGNVIPSRRCPSCQSRGRSPLSRKQRLF